MKLFCAALLFSCLVLIRHVAADKKSVYLCTSNDDCKPKGLGVDCFCVKTNGDYGYCKCEPFGHFSDCNTDQECQTFHELSKNCFCKKYDVNYRGECVCDNIYG